jgi:acyl carrier protein
MMEHIDIIRVFIVDNFLFGDDRRMVDDTSFLESGIIDSTGMLELVSFLEERFGIRVEDEEFVPDNLDSLQNLSVFIGRKLEGKALI